jgi:hypothetical protein
MPVAGAVVAIAWVCAFCTLGYMLPWAVAATRGGSNQLGVGLVNCFLGWSLIGWIVALVMACQAHSVMGVWPGFGPVAGSYPAPAGYGHEYWDRRIWTGHRAP